MIKQHVHKLEPTETVVPLHSYVHENGKIVKDLITGRDVLRGFRCTEPLNKKPCPYTETIDIEHRKVNA